MIHIEGAGTELAKTHSGTLNAKRAPLTVGQLELALLGRYPREDAEDWDHTGLLVGDPAALVEGVAVALDPTPGAVAQAKRAGANVLLTHHPAFIEPPSRFTPGNVVYAAIASGVALVNVHTALDASVEATRMFPRMMGFELRRLLAPLATDPDKGYAMYCEVRAGDEPFKLAHLAARATSVFGRQPRVWGDFEDVVKTVVICNGSAGDFAKAALDARADCLLCGEVRYHAALEATGAGMAIVELGHDVSEFPLCALLAQAAADAGVPQEAIAVLDQSSNWRYPDPTRM